MGGAPMSTSKPVDNPADAFLQPHDFVGISFWIISIAMIASTVFFYAEARTLSSHWKTSRYVDWSITVPLQMIEFNLILKAAGKATSALGFWKLLLGTIVMIGFGYSGEIKVIPPVAGFVGGMCGWGFILFEIFLGEAGGTATTCSDAVKTSFSNMRLIVTIGWSIYPLGYFFGYLNGAISDDALK